MELTEPQTSPEHPSHPAATPPSKRMSGIPLAIMLAGAMVSGSILYVGLGSSTASLGNAAAQIQPTEAPVKITDPSTLFGEEDSSLGNSSAKVTIVEFSDFQCPFCRTFYTDTFGQLKKDYIDTGKVRLIFRNYPLPFHDAARPSALAGACAKEQGKFWEYHDKIFSEEAKQGQGTVSYGVPELKTWASQIGLNTSLFNQCLDSQKFASKIDADTSAGTAAGVSGTPSFFINGQLLVGAQPYAQFKALIDAQL